MDIPDEVLEQAIDAAYSAVDGTEPAGTWGDVRMTVEAAAPIIARAAQVAILREMTARIHAAAPIAGSGGGMAVYRELAAVLSDEANALEAGAGQAEVRDE